MFGDFFIMIGIRFTFFPSLWIWLFTIFPAQALCASTVTNHLFFLWLYMLVCSMFIMEDHLALSYCFQRLAKFNGIATIC